MKIIVGLGNPGPKYETTRHNAGFLAIDRIAENWNLSGEQNKFNARVISGLATNGEKVLLMKPETFMNLSGKSVGAAMDFFQCEPTDLIVIHDDLDLPPLSLRLKTGGGAVGHNGLKSIDQALGGKTGYHRIRIGVGHPARLPEPRRQDPADYVLEPFTDQELSELDTLLENVTQSLDMIMRGEMIKAMNRFNTLVKE